MSQQRVAGLIRAATGDMAALARSGQAGLRASFLARVPEDASDRERRADLLWRAHMAKLTNRSIRTRSRHS